MGLDFGLLRHAPLRTSLRPCRGGKDSRSARGRAKKSCKGPRVTRKDVPFSNTEPFRYAAGGALGDPRPSGGVTCPECGRSWYRNSAPAVRVAIVRDGKALVTVRAQSGGRIDVPGGFVEVGEHPVRGIEREVREELGMEIEVEEAGLAGHAHLRARWDLGPRHQFSGASSRRRAKPRRRRGRDTLGLGRRH